MSFHQISIIIPTHNNGGELRRAILSLIAQDAPNGYSIEIVIVNDASGDEYLEQLNQLIRDFPVCRLLHMKRKSGPAAARNSGILSAKGNLIGFLDADDEWPPNKLSLLLPYFESNEIAVAGGKIKYMVQDGLPDINMTFEDEESRITHVHLGALLVRKNLFEKDLFFDVSLTYSEDVDWWCRLREKNIGIVISEATTLLYHVHGKNMSVNKGIDELQLLKILHQSVKRRKNNLQSQFMPQVKDFRIDQEDPLISIILPLYNGKDLIKKTLDSVFNQTYTHWELIIVDDGSTDNGADFVAAQYPQAIIIRQINAGVAAARNTGIKHSNGEIIAFLDQDDEWIFSKLREQWDLLKKDPYCVFVTCNQRFICHDGVTLPANFSEKLMEEHRAFVPSALLIRKQALLSVGMFDESLEVSSDFELIRRLRKAKYKESNVDRLLLKKWFHGDNASQNKPVLRKEILGLLYRQIKER
ncbi:glycosyltransferase [Mucilaginibacter sp. L196]|uniref:glycosyltransferase family 2 protein n=1 Tax=Mucilaginibacter sp. L196 TaxID=1641870 RepID=UPI00131DCC42|nr:glycosyltransferase [Mucilaginibacter sp. L196]